MPPNLWEPQFDEETDVKLLLDVASTWIESNNKMPCNCRNISDEVFPGIHVGDKGAAKNTFYLKKVGVTHVLNTAEGQRNGTVDTSQEFYKPFGIKYKGLKLLDVAQTNIAIYFNEVAEFIEEALQNGGKVLVNCMMGMSRSSTCVLAYLMLRQNMTAVEALTEVRKHRDVRPNDGFLRQLADLDNKLRRERGQLTAARV
jgi:predicted enzyme related to lactoylglutathione lyase